MLLQFIVWFDILLLLLSSKFFEFLTFKYFYLSESSQKQVNFYNTLENSKTKLLEIFFLQPWSLYFVLFTKIAFFHHFNRIQFLHMLFHTLRCLLIFQHHPRNFQNMWSHSFQEILLLLLFCYFCSKICSGFRIMTSQFEFLL